MKIAHAGQIQWHRNADVNVRSGAGLQIKRLLTGEPGALENYMCNIAKNEGDYGSPRHRHNFDQIRIALDGDMRIGPQQVVKQGQVGYFPEGTHYGPYDDGGRERTIMIVQFGGTSGSGYVSEIETARGKAALLREGEFRDGIFRRTSGSGKKNQDAFEAVWEHCTGRKLVYPPPRYDMPIVLDPASFAWRPTGTEGVDSKLLGAFTERKTRIEVIRIAAGARWTVNPEQAIQILFVMDGEGLCADEAYEQHTAVEVGAGEAPVFAADRETEIVALVMPLLAQTARKVA